ncbi:phosphoglycerate kinase [Natronococcus sp. A-GB1]|uniref:phosphoglycerate kinase n=1 Tax=Natronococcus sp. A-GB1 TaxID=3037648 RepID=UPI00241F83DC|nr:phosphoglycerate kinase [Natronococcus sp. A-GB1]MDG5760067.1 phosphoglycerate kinase [Natronococcus sp. A-GB1]
MATFRTIDDLEPGRRLPVRIDVNTAVEDGIVQDSRRFASHAETIRELLADNHLNHPVEFVADTYGEDALAAIDDLESGDVLLLENARMCDEELPEEEPDVKAETDFVRTLAPEFDAHVGDAYSAAHRSHASIVGFPRVMDAYAGRVMEQEYTAITAVREREFDGPVTMVLGGTKAEDVIPIIERLDDTVDRFCLGGVVGELFLQADGYDVGYDVAETSLFDHQWDDHRGRLERTLEAYRDRLSLPTDLAYEDDDGERVEASLERLEKDRPFLDVGSETADRYADVVEDDDAVFVKGALGVFEDERFAHGTVTVVSAIVETDCFSVVGGGDIARVVELYDLDEDDFSRVTVAGGAYVRALTGDPLVGVEILEGGG